MQTTVVTMTLASARPHASSSTRRTVSKENAEYVVKPPITPTDRNSRAGSGSTAASSASACTSPMRNEPTTLTISVP